MHRVALAAAVVAMIAAGCTSSSGVTSPTQQLPSVPTATTAVEQTLPASTTPTTSASATTGVATSAAPASIAPPTVAVTAASAPGTSSSPTTLSPTAAVTAAVYAFGSWYNQCSIAPDRCDPETSNLAAEGPAKANMISYIASLKSHQIHLSSDLRGGYVVVTQVTFDSPTVAEATFCGYDAGILLGPPGPDGKATIVDDTITSAHRKYKMFLEGGTWKVGQDDLVDKLGDGNKCPPAP